MGPFSGPYFVSKIGDVEWRPTVGAPFNVPDFAFGKRTRKWSRFLFFCFFFLLASVFMYCFKLRGLKPALCYVVPGMADGRELYASTLAPVAAMQNRPWHGMAWRGVLAQHRKLATCEDRRMTTSKHHGITESQHESSDFKTKQQQCTRTTSKQHNPYMHVCPRARMYVSMYVCTHVCMSA